MVQAAQQQQNKIQMLLHFKLIQQNDLGWQPIVFLASPSNGPRSGLMDQDFGTCVTTG
jgi:hypothetical protein